MSLDISYPEIRRHIGRYLGFGDNPDSFDQSGARAVDDAILAGMRDFYMPIIDGVPYRWSFLTRWESFTTQDDAQDYPCPADFVRMASPLFVDGEKFLLRQISPAQVEAIAQRNPENTTPLYFAVIRDATQPAETRYQLRLYPVPDREFEVSYWHTFAPVVDLIAGKPLGGADHARTILQCCLAQAQIMMNPEALNQDGGLHITKAEQLLRLSVESDRSLQSLPQTQGPP